MGLRCELICDEAEAWILRGRSVGHVGELRPRKTSSVLVVALGRGLQNQDTEHT